MDRLSSMPGQSGLSRVKRDLLSPAPGPTMQPSRAAEASRAQASLTPDTARIPGVATSASVPLPAARSGGGIDRLPRDPELDAKLAELMRCHGLGNAGATVMDLNAGVMAGFGENRNLSPASVIKVPLMVEVMKQIEGGKLSLDTRLPITKENWTHSVEDVLKVGESRTVGDLLKLMITKSDNVATNTLIDAVGRQNMNRTMGDLGLPDISFKRKLSMGIRVEGHLKVTNTATSRAMAELFRKFESGYISTRDGKIIVGPEGTRRMREWLGANEDDSMMQRGLKEAGLSTSARLFNKTGGHSRALNDAGIIEVGDRRYVLSIFTPQGEAGGKTAEGRLAAVTRDLIRFLETRQARRDARTP